MSLDKLLSFLKRVEPKQEAIPGNITPLPLGEIPGLPKYNIQPKQNEALAQAVLQSAEKEHQAPLIMLSPTTQEIKSIEQESPAAVGHTMTGGVINVPSHRQAIPEITAVGLKAMIDSGAKLKFIDVREPYEYSFNHILEAVNFPIEDLSSRMKEIKFEYKPEDQLVVYCHHGIRGARGAQILLEAGFKNVRNLHGGIDEWSLKADLAMPRYNRDIHANKCIQV